MQVIEGDLVEVRFDGVPLYGVATPNGFFPIPKVVPEGFTYDSGKAIRKCAKHWVTTQQRVGKKKVTLTLRKPFEYAYFFEMEPEKLHPKSDDGKTSKVYLAETSTGYYEIEMEPDDLVCVVFATKPLEILQGDQHVEQVERLIHQSYVESTCFCVVV